MTIIEDPRPYPSGNDFAIDELYSENIEKAVANSVRDAFKEGFYVKDVKVWPRNESERDTVLCAIVTYGRTKKPPAAEDE